MLITLVFNVNNTVIFVLLLITSSCAQHLSLSLLYIITLLLNKCKNYVTINNLLLIVQYFF